MVSGESEAGAVQAVFCMLRIHAKEFNYTAPRDCWVSSVIRRRDMMILRFECKRIPFIFWGCVCGAMVVTITTYHRDYSSFRKEALCSGGKCGSLLLVYKVNLLQDSACHSHRGYCFTCSFSVVKWNPCHSNPWQHKRFRAFLTTAW